ncbi:Mrr restriction system protein [Vibrio ruber DSM 16370]|uniref:Mrr restriction system protein n=1 Tax=Vibrio ruber (strain DSM 16370 / JCM 11486 / BCRC 17186 / CECT 7878 / LMG 23124 / VR1) TaxID=1123498 RepID=A0A1R4LP84_VIBR1|nr:restriction endonuclease [Vibrio ruber]SJN58074.1 Mrr restriction system protein [Vibrio ruber DSM 16370]
MKIFEAAIQAIHVLGKPSKLDEIYNTIVEYNFYRFGSKTPLAALRVTLDRHCQNKNISQMHKERYFYKHSDGEYELLEQYRTAFPSSHVVREPMNSELQAEQYIQQISTLADKQKEKAKAEILEYLRTISPQQFEEFSCHFLSRYGFKNMLVTSISRDGGIDVKGALKIGIAEMRVAAQCKRYAEHNKVGRPDISQFRGDISGEFEQGIFITTSRFTKEAMDISYKTGCVPIVLIDGEQLAEIMIDKEIGIQKQTIAVYDFDADLIFE